MKDKMFIIAEIGVNHNGSYDQAIDLIHIAHDAGADAVKFQCFNPTLLSRENLELANYQKINTFEETSQNQMLEKLRLSNEDFFNLKDYSDKLGIEFMSTAFDSENLKFVIDVLGLTKLKISSGDITNAPLLLQHAMTNKEIILSSGASSIEDIHNALKIFKFANLKKDNNFKPKELYQFIESDDNDYSSLKDIVSILHCTSEYPAPLPDINIGAIKKIADETGLKVGLSDHSTSIYPGIAAYAIGARIIEKHITLSNTLDGPDHAASLEPKPFREMIKGIREIELAYGTEDKVIQNSELNNKNIIRRSICAKENIKKGEAFSQKNLVILRPSGGISPFDYWKLLNQKSSKEYRRGDMISE